MIEQGLAGGEGKEQDIGRKIRQNKITWRSFKRKRKESPVLRKILLACLILELGVFTYLNRPGYRTVVVFGNEEPGQGTDTEALGRLFIRIYYE